MREDDRVSIVVYAGASGLVLPPTPGNDQHKIMSALSRLEAGGSTAGALTTTEPAAPLVKIQVAAVIRSHQNEGQNITIYD